jgi:hypothetical protein
MIMMMKMMKIKAKLKLMKRVKAADPTGAS